MRGFLAYLSCNYAHLPSFELARNPRYDLTDASTFVGHSESDEMFQRPMRSPRSILSPSKPAQLAEQYQIVLKWMCWVLLVALLLLLLRRGTDAGGQNVGEGISMTDEGCCYWLAFLTD